VERVPEAARAPRARDAKRGRRVRNYIVKVGLEVVDGSK
jgi:hypothetical protein